MLQRHPDTSRLTFRADKKPAVSTERQRYDSAVKTHLIILMRTHTISAIPIAIEQQKVQRHPNVTAQSLFQCEKPNRPAVRRMRTVRIAVVEPVISVPGYPAGNQMMATKETQALLLPEDVAE